jgi:hypothetical protein
MDYKKNKDDSSNLLTKTSKILKSTKLAGKSTFKSLASDVKKPVQTMKHSGLPQSLKRI